MTTPISGPKTDASSPETVAWSAPVDVEAADEVAAALTLVARLLIAPPDVALLTALRDEPSGEFPLATRPGARGALAKITVEARAVSTDDLQALVEVLDGEFERLFRGPGHVLATPFESVYMSEEHLVFQPPTAHVRSWFAHHGLEWSRKGAEPEDHIGLELEFLGHLIGNAFESENPRAVLVEARRFAVEHPFRFVWDFQSRFQATARSAFYQGTCSYLAVTLAALEDLLGLEDQVR